MCVQSLQQRPGPGRREDISRGVGAVGVVTPCTLTRVKGLSAQLVLLRDNLIESFRWVAFPLAFGAAFLEGCRLRVQTCKTWVESCSLDLRLFIDEAQLNEC